MVKLLENALPDIKLFVLKPRPDNDIIKLAGNRNNYLKNKNFILLS